MSYDFVIVGAGFAGSVCARQLAEAGYDVLVVDKRAHIGGNAYDCVDKQGILIHPYGPHIFHTNSKRVFSYLSAFTHWRFYEHRVLADVEGALYPIPINRTTINKLYDLSLDEKGAAEYLEGVRSQIEEIRTSEDVVLSSVGPDLCDKFFRGYTRKQWGLDLADLSAGVAARIPTRTNDDDRYFTDTFQFMPANGYNVLFANILDHRNIKVELQADFFEIRNRLNYRHLIFSGPIDEYFEFCFGRLPYRSLRFDHQHLDVDRYQDVGTINYPVSEAYTRITEFKHLTGQTSPGTSIVREYPESEGDPFYPVPRTANQALARQYKDLAVKQDNVSFVGRLAQYQYYNMDQVVGAALTLADRILGVESRV